MCNNNLQCDTVAVPGAEEVEACLVRLKSQHDDFLFAELRLSRVRLLADKSVDVTCQT